VASGISKSVRLHVNLGNYENAEVSATAWVDDVGDFGGDTNALAYLDTIIKKAIAPQVAEYAGITKQGNSFLADLDDSYFPEED
jgi:hypothetical protein